jgi:alpha-amylase/alpha-mannosidase (GH57 family)
VKRVSLAFLWHLHQPLYRLRGEKVCTLPWVRLHAIRSYYDMVRVLEEFPEIRITVNLVPSLIEQIQAYIAGDDDLFRATASVPAEDLDGAHRAFLVEHFFSASRDRMIAPFRRYAELHAKREKARRLRGREEAWREFSDAELRDLQVLFDLAWFGFKAREDFADLRSLAERGAGFDHADVLRLHAIEDEILRRILPLYRAAAKSGQVEVSTSPYAHPILPLLIDTESAREAMPKAPLPPRLRAEEDARAQIADALVFVEREIGTRPRGLWPSEGSVSQELAVLLSGTSLGWAATDEAILEASEREGPFDPRIPWRVEGAGSVDFLFRDHELSDRIGFSYARIDASTAVAELLASVRQRAERHDGKEAVVLVALDGENPWENYPHAGAEFLRTLYGALAGHPGIGCRTVAEAAAEAPKRGAIRRLRAGSWINADFGIWIGGPERNRAWSLLDAVRSKVRAALAEGGHGEQAKTDAWASLRAAEGSDWFWWLDGQFASTYRSQFDEAFRGHLRQALEAVGLPVPEALGEPIPSAASRDGEGPAPEPGTWLRPRVDGFENDFFEWEGAIRLDWASLVHPSAMQRSRAPVLSLHIGFTREGAFVMRLDPAPAAGPPFAAGLEVDLGFRSGSSVRHVEIRIDGKGELVEARRWESAPGKGGAPAVREASAARAAARKILEASVPAQETGLAPGDRPSLLVRLRIGGEEIPLDEIGLQVPSFASLGRSWSAL